MDVRSMAEDFETWKEALDQAFDEARSDLTIWERDREALHAYRDGLVPYRQARAFIQESPADRHPTQMALSLLESYRRDKIPLLRLFSWYWKLKMLWRRRFPKNKETANVR